jgi:hypothetical protein
MQNVTDWRNEFRAVPNDLGFRCGPVSMHVVTKNRPKTARPTPLLRRVTVIRL